MSRSKHDRVLEILYNLVKELYENSYAHHGIHSGYKSIDIITKIYSNRAAVTYSYSPDLWCKLKRSGRIDVYEVWDTQSEDACARDILFSALTPNISSLSIICFDEYMHKMAENLVNVILYSLHDDKGNYLLDPNDAKPYITLIPENIQNNDEKIKELLRKKLHL